MNRPRQVSSNRSPPTTQAGKGSDSGTLIDQLFRVIQQRIQNGTLSGRSRLPSVRQLAAEHHVSNETAHRAYDKLVAHGYIEARRGSGFYVTPTVPTPVDSPVQRWAQQLGAEHDWRSLFDCELPYERRPGCGILPDAWMDRTVMSNALRSLSRIPARAISDYESPRGYLALRQQLQVKLAEHGIYAEPDQILTTGGATEALHLILWSFINHPRTYVMVEDPAPTLHIQRCLAAGLEVIRVPRDPDGPNIEVMRELCIEHKPRAFLCSSILHNPTSSNLSPHKAFQVLRLAEEFEFFIIDDDSYGDLLPPMDANPVTRLGTLDQLKRVFHIGSFSKTLGSGLRVGFIAGSYQHIERVALFKAASTISNPTLGERVVYQILSQGKYRHYCEALRSRLLDMRDKTMAQLTELGITFPVQTSAGMYLWGSLGDQVDSFAVARAMADRNYLMAPSSFFTQYAKSYMRFNVPATFQSPAIAELRTVLRNYSKDDQKGPSKKI